MIDLFARKPVAGPLEIVEVVVATACVLVLVIALPRCTALLVSIG